MSDSPAYSLALSDQEVDRYRFMAQLARANEEAHWEQAGLVDGARVADVGCGPGLVLLELVDIVGPSGHVTGVDRQPSAVETATKLVHDRAVANATIVSADAWATGLEADAFDVVNIRHVLAHNTPDDQRRILTHAFELLRPGGAAYIVDVDLTGSRIDPVDDDLDDLQDRYVSHLRDTGRDPAIGPKLGSMLAGVGFDGIDRGAMVGVLGPQELMTTRPPAWAARQAMVETGHATEADIDRWDRALEQLAATATTMNRASFYPLYFATGRKPSR